MNEPIFRMTPARVEMPEDVLSIAPYRHRDAWVFDDPTTGLVAEPFVAGITEMIDRLTAGIANAATGFRLLFAIRPFDGYQTSLAWVRPDPVEGHWYRADDLGDEGWLCPALFCYFPTPPARIYIRAEAMQSAVNEEISPCRVS